MTDSLRLADRLALMAAQIERLEEQKSMLKASMRLLCETAEPSEDEIAEAYWRIKDIPVAALGPQQAVLAAAQKHPYWSWECQRCGAEVFIRSRSELAERQRARSYMSNLCPDCQHDEQEALQGARQEEQRRREARERELRTMRYKLYLKTDEWQVRRKAALRRAGYRCQVCNRSRVLHVHHRTYERRGVELARDLIALCDNCHALYHGKGLLASHPEGEES